MVDVDLAVTLDVQLLLSLQAELKVNSTLAFEPNKKRQPSVGVFLFLDLTSCR